MEILERKQAKLLIATAQLAELGNNEILDILLEYWYDDEADIRSDIACGTYPEISDELINIIVTTECPNFPLPEEISLLLTDHLSFRLNKVSNTYLENKLESLGLQYRVQGEIEPAAACPCCEYLAIDTGEDGLWDICPVCFWENGGSGPNHLSLAEAKANFLSLGAINQLSLKFVDPEGRLKYVKYCGS